VIPFSRQKGAPVLADPQFLRRLQIQETAAVLALVERYYAPVGHYLARLLGDPQLAEDLTQDTFLDAYVALPRLQPGSNLGAWLFQIATNRARKHLRRRRLVRWLALDALPGHRDDEADRVAQRDVVGAALARLPEHERVCLLLQVWGGLSTAEIAAAVGKREAAVRMTLVRARRRFRAHYEEGER
jgi:RNA polymerase sigma-70 factor (ECF subfamily)